MNSCCSFPVIEVLNFLAGCKSTGFGPNSFLHDCHSSTAVQLVSVGERERERVRQRYRDGMRFDVSVPFSCLND